MRPGGILFITCRLMLCGHSRLLLYLIRYPFLLCAVGFKYLLVFFHWCSRPYTSPFQSRHRHAGYGGVMHGNSHSHQRFNAHFSVYCYLLAICIPAAACQYANASEFLLLGQCTAGVGCPLKKPCPHSLSPCVGLPDHRLFKRLHICVL